MLSGCLCDGPVEYFEATFKKFKASFVDKFLLKGNMRSIKSL